MGGPILAEILIVDDDDIICDTLCELLSENYCCDAARSVEEAFAKLAAKQFDLLLTDISMSGPTGFELPGKLVQRYPKTPIIVISGIGDQEHAQALIKLGAFDFLLKPFRLEVVEKSVRRALEYRRKRIEAADTSNDRADAGGA